MDWRLFFTIIGTGFAIVGFIYNFMRNFKNDINKRFEVSDRRFEMMDQRMFLLCMGKTLPEVLKAEREKFYEREEV